MGVPTVPTVSLCSTPKHQSAVLVRPEACAAVCWDPRCQSNWDTETWPWQCCLSLVGVTSVTFEFQMAKWPARPERTKWINLAPSGVAAKISATRLLKGSSSAFQVFRTQMDFRMPDFPQHPVMLAPSIHFMTFTTTCSKRHLKIPCLEVTLRTMI